jgi:homeobox protein YOX1/YHP1
MPMNPHGHPHNLFDDIDTRNEPRASSPFGRSGNPAQIGQSYTPPPISPTSTEEPAIKKKRKRADAAQLKVLNETYARTAFPSTEERAALAKQLDMTPRSVQIWFQNKRQSMRQTNRQSSTAGSSHQSFAVSVQDGGLDDLRYEGGITMTEPFLPGAPGEIPRSHTSHSHSHHSSSHHSTHGHSGDSVDPRKQWSARGGY